MVLSALPEAKILPSGLNATLVTEPLCPVRVEITLSVDRFHSLMVLSSLPEAKVLPSGLNATLLTEPLCKISGAQWKEDNVPQVLAHRCAYLNRTISP